MVALLTRTGFSFFVFSWTVVYFVWMAGTILKYPIAYHWIAHMSVTAHPTAHISLSP